MARLQVNLAECLLFLFRIFEFICSMLNGIFGFIIDADVGV